MVVRTTSQIGGPTLAEGTPDVATQGVEGVPTMEAPAHHVWRDPPGIADVLKADSRPIIGKRPLGLNPTSAPAVEKLDTFGRIAGQGI